jgi:hypothetical protein
VEQEAHQEAQTDLMTSSAQAGLAKQDPKAVEAFLLNQEERLAARVRREVLNKLTTGVKSPRRM